MQKKSNIHYIFILVGVLCFAGGFWAYDDTQRFLSEALLTEGKVVDMLRSRSQDSTTYRPVIRFATIDGDVVEFTSSTGTNPPSYSTGETVEIYYDQYSPQDAIINDFLSLWFLVLVLSVIGAVFFLVGFGLIISANRPKNK